MFDPLFAYFRSYTNTPFTDEETERIKSLFVYKKFRKRQYFLQEGEIPQFTGFIIKGAMRKYSVDDKGEEHVHDLFLENWWVTDRENAITQTKSSFFIDAWEETEVLMTKLEFEQVIEEIPALKDWERKLSKRNILASRQRLQAAIGLSAEQRYAELEKAYPEFLQRFPQHIIASYLGINKVTLSRIRSNAGKK